MKILRLVLILSVILSVFSRSRSHYRRRSTGIFENIVLFTRQAIGQNKQLADRVVAIINNPAEKYNCSKYAEILTGSNMKVILDHFSENLTNECTLKCDGWQAEQTSQFHQIVDHAASAFTMSEDSLETVQELIHHLGKRVRNWAWADNCMTKKSKNFK
jgi:hypothetical protein